MADIDWGEVGNNAAGVIGDAGEAIYDFGTDAFNWIENNPETSQILAGVVGGAGQYLAAKEERKANERFQMDVMDRRKKERQIKPGEIQNYGSHIGELNKGLLTNGMIAGD